MDLFSWWVDSYWILSSALLIGENYKNTADMIGNITRKKDKKFKIILVWFKVHVGSACLFFHQRFPVSGWTISNKSVQENGKVFRQKYWVKKKQDQLHNRASYYTCIFYKKSTYNGALGKGVSYSESLVCIIVIRTVDSLEIRFKTNFWVQTLSEL